jgi:hypothetical protein
MGVSNCSSARIELVGAVGPRIDVRVSPFREYAVRSSAIRNGVGGALEPDAACRSMPRPVGPLPLRVEFDTTGGRQNLVAPLFDFGLGRDVGPNSKPGCAWAQRKLASATAAGQSALEWAPRSASKRDPFVLRFRRLAVAPSELVGVAETARAGVVV